MDDIDLLIYGVPIVVCNIVDISPCVYGPSLVVNDATLEGISPEYLTNVLRPLTDNLTVSIDVSYTWEKSIWFSSEVANIIYCLISI